MKSKSLKSQIKKALDGLEWPILIEPHEMPVIRIVSNPHKKSHIILMPDKIHNRSSDLDYLHELGHATLCERVHPVFAVNILFAPLTNKKQFLPVIPAFNAACDWFVGDWQMEISPKAARKQLEENVPLAEEVLGAPQIPPLEIILDASLIIAQSIHYLDDPIDCVGPLKLAVDAFISIPPDKPSLHMCVFLTNRLMATYTDQRVRFNEAGDASAWEVYTADKAKLSDEASTGLKS
jgi:hypothetical protein